VPEYRVETRVSRDRSLTIKDLPFEAGAGVEVIIRKRDLREREHERYPLRGKPVRYVDPLGSVAEEDWNALK
jgi:hypothetical protein